MPAGSPEVIMIFGNAFVDEVIFCGLNYSYLKISERRRGKAKRNEKADEPMDGRGRSRREQAIEFIQQAALVRPALRGICTSCTS